VAPAARCAGRAAGLGLRAANMPPPAALDCVIVGAGPAGLTAALYFARFKRRFLIVDAGCSRARWIPASHNIPWFAGGISGHDMLRRQREHVLAYGVDIVRGQATALARDGGGFSVAIEPPGAAAYSVAARRVLLATGAVDIEPKLRDLPNAIERGLVRYCPICDGYEASARKIGVLGHGASGLAEAVFIARTYARDVTLLTLGETLTITPDQQRTAASHAIRIVETPVVGLAAGGARISVVTLDGGAALQFDVLYSALGLQYRNGLAVSLGARRDAAGALLVDDHNQTSVRGLYAAGAIVRGLDQIVVAMGHAAVAATSIHNTCELPMEEEASVSF
jgi:thioredoxin reductase (NADPH)